MIEHPREIVGRDWRSTFGVFEYEEALKKIVDYLADDTLGPDIPPGCDFGNNRLGWRKLFRVDTVPGVDPGIFAMLCGSGWITVNFFPKYTFWLSDKAIERLEEVFNEPARPRV